MSKPAIVLEGCTCEPLMGYLKAIGVLRLLSEQRDGSARGCWRDETFVVDTNLDQDALARFFLDEYSPTPLLAPWNGGSGFYLKLDLDRFLETGGEGIEFKGREAVAAIEAIEASDTRRLARYRAQIAETKQALAAIAHSVDFSKALADPLQQWPKAQTRAAQKRTKDQAAKILNDLLLFESGGATFSIGKADKDAFVSELRGKVLTDDALCWLDAALAMRTGQKKNRVEAPTLGTGGNIGNSDFSARFAQMLSEIMASRDGNPVPEASAKWFHASIYGTPAPNLLKASVDQFDPGRAGGANGTQGMEAEPTLNPWDYVLMMEGAVALAGGTSRRLGAARSAASFPFVVESSAAGYGAVGKDATRGEAWLPLWPAPALYPEVKFLLSEGRAEVGGARARSGLTFAQAVAGLGVDRGIRAFARYEFQERFGKNYIATPIGRFAVPKAPLDGIELIRALNGWLDSLRYACRTKDDGAKTEPPPRFPAAQRRIESAIFGFCKYGGKERLADVLAALGTAERELAVGDRKPDDRRTARPLSGLSAAWLFAADDGSPEFSLARSVAFIDRGSKGTGRIRRNLEPVEENGAYWAWSEGGPHVVWDRGDLCGNLGALLARRLMDAEKNGEPMPPLGSSFPTTLDHVAVFLDAAVDEAKIDDLIWGLSLVEHESPREAHAVMDDTDLPAAYALLKLAFLPGRLEWHRPSTGPPVLRINSPNLGDPPGGIAVKPEPAILGRLRANDVQAACVLAARRLRASGLVPLASTLADGRHRNIDWSAAGFQATRLLAALVFPIADRTANQLAQLVLRYPSSDTQL